MTEKQIVQDKQNVGNKAEVAAPQSGNFEIPLLKIYESASVAITLIE